MNTKPLEKFAQTARRQLLEQVRAKLEQVLSTDSAALRAKADAVATLNNAIAAASREAVVEKVAYTWFNRFCALRYMDANQYTPISIVSPAAGNTQPEILQEAKAGHIDLALEPFVDSQHIFALLSGQTSATDPQTEAYRLLLVGSCNQYHHVMPFMFEEIDDYTELLMPDDLLSAHSILQATRAALTVEVCQDVEVIGWLYQFYISEKKDAVIGAKQKITPENIPAATQLFTPNWIVRYLVQNSLGRLWLLNHPHSRLGEQMEFYIAPDQTSDFLEKSDVLAINTPETLTICDPAVGSGHMLTYAFDLLVAIYEEEGYTASQIPQLILQNNLFGFEIDERAAALAAFALTMKARAYDRRFFRRGVAPNITLLSPIRLTDDEVDTELAELAPLLSGGSDLPQQMSLLATEPKQHTLSQASGWQALHDALRHDLTLFAEADNFGALLRPLLTPSQHSQLLTYLANRPATDLFGHARTRRTRQALAQAERLARQYDVVIANPPYMGSKNLNESIKKFAKHNYPNSKSDLFSMFIEAGLSLVSFKGFLGMVTMQSWMFLSSYKSLRERILEETTIINMAHLGALAFDTLNSKVAATSAYVIQNSRNKDYNGAYFRIINGKNERQKQMMLKAGIQNPDCGYFYHAATTDFQKIHGSPIAYWVSDSLRNIFPTSDNLGKHFEFRIGMATGKNDLYVRTWQEVEHKKIGFKFESRIKAQLSNSKWFPYTKGGGFRKWAGNEEYIVNWENDGSKLQKTKHPTSDRIWAHNFNLGHIFSPAICWTVVTSTQTGFRLHDKGFLFDAAAGLCQPLFEKTLESPLGLLNSKISTLILPLLNPTLNMHPGYLSSLPFIQSDIHDVVQGAVKITKADWDSYETSWDFTSLSLVTNNQEQVTLAFAYAALRNLWQTTTSEIQQLEEENNRLFITAYGLQGELTPDVPLSEITLTCNPLYRYGSKPLSVNSGQLKQLADNWPLITKNWPPGQEGHELRLLADTMRELISYAVGCMFGRYSLDAPGLILANQGETVADYIRKVNSGQWIVDSQTEEVAATHYPLSTNDHQLSFMPDDDNAIPMLNGDWFSDDITERFKKFLRVTFGDAHYEENLAFIEAALGRDLRSYFLRDFYDHHVKMYKKRPIYWLFSSAKGSFNVLIYMHRYQPDTVSVVLNDYLREFRAKLTAQKAHLEGVSVSASSPQRDKTRALKEIGSIDKTLKEIREYEDDILYPLATRQLSIDLDDGVKVNYNKFGKALKKVTGLTGK